METFRIENLTFSYPEQEEKALDNISAVFNKGDFITICGPSGCGKSTLLRQLKTVMAPAGTLEGNIYFEDRLLSETDNRTQSTKIGFVQQSPENQIITDKVWHELAFGLESLGYDTPSIRRRVAEIASFFGIQDWFYKKVSELSGGQKQLLNLASIMVMQPTVLILDEPTSQLDPIAASDFIATVGKINRELGTTVIITEHRLEEVFPLSDKVFVMDCGKLVAEGTPREAGQKLRLMNHSMFVSMPAPMRVWAKCETGSECPITVRDGAAWLKEYADKNELFALPKEPEHNTSEEVAISLEGVWFRYEKDLPDVVKGLNLNIRKGEFYALLGGNGSGKTTSLSIIGGLRRAYRGEITVNGSIAILPQNPQTLFVCKTVREDLLEVFRGLDVSAEERQKRLAQVVTLCKLTKLLDRHPYDLSGGEQQRAALAKVLLLGPEILLMDEPTKGLDAEFKETFAGIMETLLQSGVTIFMVSHDVEFCAKYAHRCGMFFDGNITSEGTPRKFFTGNNFYTTSVNRMAREIAPGAVTVDDLIFVCTGKATEKKELAGEYQPVSEKSEETKKEKLPVWRTVLAGISGLATVYAMTKILGVTDLSQIVNSDGVHLEGSLLIWTIVLIASLFVLTFSVTKKQERKGYSIQMAKEERKLPKRTILASAMILFLIPITLVIGVYYLGNTHYYIIATAILLETMIPFALIFEGRKPKARELVIIAVICAIAVAGRAAFFMLPNFKPVLAIVIIAGVGLGAESGFLVGAMSMLVSNVMFGQGPWTPWQMFAMGIIGFSAGILFKKGVLLRSRLSLSVFGAISAVVIYGGIMNPVSALMWAHSINLKLLLSYYVTGFPVDLVHGSATFLTLWFAAEPMLEKLDRIKLKYGLLES